ncbi:MAG: DinB family protein [Chloroflexota bacterium]|nr:DinB family protein [Chloroflexota bacterium]
MTNRVSTPIPTDASAFLRDLVTRLQRSTLSRLKRVDPAALYWQPDPEANSIGVTIWHYTRWFDLFGTVSLVGGKIDDQHWFVDGWLKKTGYDPRGIGFEGLGLITGYTVAEMQAVPHLGAAELAEYHQAAMGSVLAALANNDAASLTGLLRIGTDEDTRFEQMLGLILGANRHLGEIDALVSLFSRRMT